MINFSDVSQSSSTGSLSTSSTGSLSTSTKRMSITSTPSKTGEIPATEKAKSSKETTNRLPPELLDIAVSYVKPRELSHILEGLKSREAVAAILKYDGNNQGEKDLYGERAQLHSLCLVSTEWNKEFGPALKEIDQKILYLKRQKVINEKQKLMNFCNELERSLNESLRNFARGGVV